MKRIIALVLVVVLCLSMSVKAFAATTSKSGSTSGGTSGTLSTSGTLTVNRDAATAQTTYETGVPNASAATTVILYFINANNQNDVASNSGTTRATAGNNYGSGYSGSSQHRVSGGTYWGSWSCSLNTSAS